MVIETFKFVAPILYAICVVALTLRICEFVRYLHIRRGFTKALQRTFPDAKVRVTKFKLLDDDSGFVQAEYEITERVEDDE